MTQSERRKDQQRAARELRAELNESQRDTLAELERYGWQLKFVRRPIFQPSIPVVFDGDRNHEIWHGFVLGGAGCHYITVLFYVV